MALRSSRPLHNPDIALRILVFMAGSELQHAKTRYWRIQFVFKVMSPSSPGGATATSENGLFGEMRRLWLPHAATRAVDIAGGVGGILSGKLDVNGGELGRLTGAA